MITSERAQVIILCYGGNPSAWPEHERTALKTLLKQSEHLRELQKQALSIDEFMGFIAPEPEIFDKQMAVCAKRILAYLPGQTQNIDRGEHPEHWFSAWQKMSSNIMEACRWYRLPLFRVAGLSVLGIMLLIKIVPPEGNVEGDLFLTEDMEFYLNDNFQDDRFDFNEEMDMLAFLDQQVWDEAEEAF